MQRWSPLAASARAKRALACLRASVVGWGARTRLEKAQLSRPDAVKPCWVRFRAPPTSHRYVILVYRQPGPVNFVEAKMAVTKYMFDLEEWTGKLRLGDPVAVTYFTCEYEPGCHAACLLSALCCAFCCWSTPSRDFHRRAKETGGYTGAAPPRARRGGGADASVHMA